MFSWLSEFFMRGVPFSPNICATDVAPRVQQVSHWLCFSYCDMRHDATLKALEKQNNTCFSERRVWKWLQTAVGRERQRRCAAVYVSTLLRRFCGGGALASGVETQRHGVDLRCSVVQRMTTMVRCGTCSSRLIGIETNAPVLSFW